MKLLNHYAKTKTIMQVNCTSMENTVTLKKENSVVGHVSLPDMETCYKLTAIKTTCCWPRAGVWSNRSPINRTCQRAELCSVKNPLKGTRRQAKSGTKYLQIIYLTKGFIQYKEFSNLNNMKIVQ